jgi:hypothetical protein
VRKFSFFNLKLWLFDEKVLKLDNVDVFSLDLTFEKEKKCFS